MYKELPIKIELIVFAKHSNKIDYLVLKRTEKEGGFWQPVTGTLEMDESIKKCLLRELKEETGINSIIKVTDEVYRFSWEKSNYTVVELVYGVEVALKKIKLNPEEHNEYKWCCFEEAVGLLGRENNKKAYLAFKQLSH